jgi:hypothetical protein
LFKLIICCRIISLTLSYIYLWIYASYLILSTSSFLEFKLFKFFVKSEKLYPPPIYIGVIAPDSLGELEIDNKLGFDLFKEDCVFVTTTGVYNKLCFWLEITFGSELFS